jgi:hypothetical protein
MDLAHASHCRAHDETLVACAYCMNDLRLLRGTQRSKKHFMLDAASTLLLAHNCRTRQHAGQHHLP